MGNSPHVLEWGEPSSRNIRRNLYFCKYRNGFEDTRGTDLGKHPAGVLNKGTRACLLKSTGSEERKDEKEKEPI